MAVSDYFNVVRRALGDTLGFARDFGFEAAHEVRETITDTIDVVGGGVGAGGTALDNTYDTISSNKWVQRVTDGAVEHAGGITGLALLAREWNRFQHRHDRDPQTGEEQGFGGGDLALTALGVALTVREGLQMFQGRGQSSGMAVGA